MTGETEPTLAQVGFSEKPINMGIFAHGKAAATSNGSGRSLDWRIPGVQSPHPSLVNFSFRRTLGLNRLISLRFKALQESHKSILSQKSILSSSLALTQ